eukprot:CAMPEP_0194477890 /NCGR_PEP_ID=MMETSP0253-20130528/1531_1 /TAXON_ID=2966 /ORGANISM="Noctiluca scintillans" /LENGTH=86 /DNA_ID=CAMNT_0039316925 /DNA_START=66 /DNA_END=323 /DNA_ORIENTATION=+
MRSPYAQRNAYMPPDEDSDQEEDNFGLLRCLDAMEFEGVSLIEVTHCVNRWYWRDVIFPCRHHGLILKASNGKYMRLHFVRSGLRW